MREIELKFKVTDQAKLLTKLESLGCEIEEIIEQKDSIYVEDLNNVKSIDGSIWIRIRKENNHIELNLKKQSKILQESKEIEFGVDSLEKAQQFLETLNYHQLVVVNKKRRYTKYLNYNICIDEVERLGNFLEIELLVSDGDEKDYLNDLLKVAKLLDLDKEDIVNSHYDTMILELDK